MSKSTVVIYQHADHPEWGRGVVLAGGRDDRLDFAFERGGRRTILKSFSSKLTPVEMAADEAVMLGNKLTNRRSSTAVKAKLASAKKPKTVASFATFEGQLAHFLKEFPEGFAGEKFSKEERGLGEGKRKKTDKEPAIAEAGELLSAAAFAAESKETIFERAAQLLKSTSFVHPLEGGNSLDSMLPEHREEFVEALGDLLHGTGDASDRFERFVAAIRLPDAQGKERRPSWPLVTVFAALVHPGEQVCVKPTFFQKQAALMKVALDYLPLPEASVYARFLLVTKKTEEALRESGQSPRDLVDVASFICLTQSAKPAGAKD